MFLLRATSVMVNGSVAIEKLELGIQAQESKRSISQISEKEGEEQH